MRGREEHARRDTIFQSNRQFASFPAWLDHLGKEVGAKTQILILLALFWTREGEEGARRDTIFPNNEQSASFPAWLAHLGKEEEVWSPRWKLPILLTLFLTRDRGEHARRDTFFPSNRQSASFPAWLDHPEKEEAGHSQRWKFPILLTPFFWPESSRTCWKGHPLSK